MCRSTLFLLIMFGTSVVVYSENPPDALEVGIFSRYNPEEAQLPEEWETMDYRLIKTIGSGRTNEEIAFLHQ